MSDQEKEKKPEGGCRPCSSETPVCATEGCEKDGKMKCPTCLKLDIPGYLYCGQECFRSSWKSHKPIHQSFKTGSAEPGKELPEVDYNAGYHWTGRLRAGVVTPRLSHTTIPKQIVLPDYAIDGVPRSELAERGNVTVKVHTPAEIERLRTVCRLGREVLDICGHAIKPGVTTEEINQICHRACMERNSYPSPLNYHSFPKSICTSVNEVICHGIPDSRKLKDGDVLNLDVTLYFDGMHGDLNDTFVVGENVDAKGKKLIKNAYDCLMSAIAFIKPGQMYRDVGEVIQKVAKRDGMSVVKSYCGHGIGELFHTAPNVPHYARNKAVGVMKVGHVFTIEPMISEGTWRDELWDDNWTAVTADGARSAQFEHTMVVTETGVEVLTHRYANSPKYFWEDEVVITQ